MSGSDDLGLEASAAFYRYLEDLRETWPPRDEQIDNYGCSGRTLGEFTTA